MADWRSAAERPVAGPPLVAVAHGSRDPRSAAAVTALVDVVRSLRPGLDVRLAFLDLCAPRLPEVLAAVHGEGHDRAVVVPLLLGRAYHARVDVPAVVRDALRRMPLLRVAVADVLGPDPRLAGAALRRLAEAGVALRDGRLGVVLAAAGSSDAAANAEVTAVARGWARRAPWVGAEAAFASAAPTVADAIRALRARGARRVAVASWFVAPGLLPDRIAHAALHADPSAVLAAPLAPAPETAEVVLDRYHAALATARGVPPSTTTAALVGL